MEKCNKKRAVELLGGRLNWNEIQWIEKNGGLGVVDEMNLSSLNKKKKIIIKYLNDLLLDDDDITRDREIPPDDIVLYDDGLIL